MPCCFCLSASVACSRHRHTQASQSFVILCLCHCTQGYWRIFAPNELTLADVALGAPIITRCAAHQLVLKPKPKSRRIPDRRVQGTEKVCVQCSTTGSLVEYSRFEILNFVSSVTAKTVSSNTNNNKLISKSQQNNSIFHHFSCFFLDPLQQWLLQKCGSP